ncbi:MAG: DNA polymerase III subunit alpha [Treponema sp.]|jgi:DNA polymerase-3 subunit alpha|nr:DNA polymerase III subunit alpha [Treponema sp.]
MTNFVHLHVHSDYSLQDAAVSVLALADRAEELGMTHLALTDHGNMFGTMDFIAACEESVNEKGEHQARKTPIKPVIGCEVYVSPGSCKEKKGTENENRYYHFVLLAQNTKGYYNLVKLCSLAYTEGFYYRPRIDDDLLKEYHEGLIALSACASGEIPRLISAGKTDEAEKKALYYRDLFGTDEEGQPNFFLEIQDHGIPAGGMKGTELSQKEICGFIADISKKTGIPLVATNDVHYLKREDYIAHDIMLCIGTGKNRSEEKRKKYYGDQFYFKTGDEMASVFSEYPQALANTVIIANRCSAAVPKINVKELPKYLPDFEIPKEFSSPDVFLKSLASEGLAKRYAKEMAADGDEWKQICKKADYELDTIINMGFTGYFLIVWDFIKYAKEHDIPVGPGRGSGAGSIVAYALRITDINPLRYGLLFERFLNPDRISMPDFDIDFANEGREEVMNYVMRKYGTERVAQIITFGTLGAKQVIRDVARVLGITIAESEMISKLVDRGTLEDSLNNEPRLAELSKDPRYSELFELAEKLEGLNRHSSIHAAGIVIGKSALDNFVPLYKDPKTGNIATQYSMNFLEQCGLVKMDFLGLKTLDVIKHSQSLISLRGGKYSDFSIENIPEDDKKTFKMLSEGKSFEIFQFESDGMQNILKQTKPTSIEDLTALNAMYRPGPMQNIPRFVDCKNGKTAITYPDPSLEAVLKETYGVIVYQEQVMEVAKIIAGYSMGKADLLRRAMGKKKKEIIDKEKVPFIEGAKAQGFSESKAGAIYDMLVPFADYGFNKSHAAAYSVLAYQTAYLKANFPLEFMAATMTNEINSTDNKRLSHCIDEARRMGIQVDPPSVNHSDKLFTVVDGRIVYGFLGIKGLGASPADEIVRGRQNGLYNNFFDFLAKVDIKGVSKKVIELLINTGAFDSFGITRETLAGNLEHAIEYAQKKKEDKLLGQSSLFDESQEKDFPDYQFEEFPAESRADRLNLEKQLLGFYFSGHPMDEYKEIWKDAVTVNLGEPENLKSGSCVLIGIIKNIKQITTSKGSKMAFASLSDYNGEIELTFFSGPWERCQNNVKNDSVVILKGKIDYQRDKDKYSFLVDNILSKHEINDTIKEIKESEEKNKVHKNTWLYMADLKSSYITQAKKGNYTVIGYIKNLRDHKDKNGNDMAFGTLQDFEGDIDIVFFSRVYEDCRHLLKLDEIIALKGSIDPENELKTGKVSFKVTSIADYPMLSRSAAKKVSAKEKPHEPDIVKATEKQIDEVHIRLKEDASDNKEDMNQLRDYLADNSGSCTIYIHIPVTDGEQKIRAMSGLDISDDKTIDGLKNCNSVAEVWRI